MNAGDEAQRRARGSAVVRVVAAPPVTAAVARVVHGGRKHPADLVAPLRLREVFAPAEMRHCGGEGRLDRWAGRLAAKRAVLAALGSPPVGLDEISIVPERTACYSPVRCRRGHPPVVRPVSPAAAFALLQVAEITLSISHTARAALAVAVAQARGSPGADHEPRPSVDLVP